MAFFVSNFLDLNRDSMDANQRQGGILESEPRAGNIYPTAKPNIKTNEQQESRMQAKGGNNGYTHQDPDDNTLFGNQNNNQNIRRAQPPQKQPEKKKPFDYTKLEQVDDKDLHLVIPETSDLTTGRFRNPETFAYHRTELGYLGCLECQGKFKMTCCLPCNLITGSGTVIINVGEAGIMLKKGIYVKTLPPGIYYYNDCLYNIEKVSLRVKTVGLNGGYLITEDGMTILIGGFISYRKFNPFYAKYSVQNLPRVLNDVAAGILKRIISANSFKTVLVKKEEIAELLRSQLEIIMRKAGILIPFADITTIQIPKEMREAMAQAAISKREAGAKRIIAEAEVESSKLLREAGKIMNQNSNSISLKYFETLKDLAVDARNKTVILPDGMVYVPN